MNGLILLVVGFEDGTNREAIGPWLLDMYWKKFPLTDCIGIMLRGIDTPTIWMCKLLNIKKV
jgi:hypothetical protein